MLKPPEIPISKIQPTLCSVNPHTCKLWNPLSDQGIVWYYYILDLNEEIARDRSCLKP